jgi:GTP-binding protein
VSAAGQDRPPALAGLPTFDADAIARGRALFLRPWVFVKGVPSLEFLPSGDRPEIAFAGRSNVGKSSLINALTAQSGLARTSNTPGRTQELNYFAPDGLPFYLVDMPGYGYAEAPKEIVDRWNTLIRDYLRGRVSLARVFALIDARHGIKPVDEATLDGLDESAVSYQVVLTKIDKPARRDAEAVYADTVARVMKRPAAFPVVLATSAEKGEGIAELRATIAEML